MLRPFEHFWRPIFNVGLNNKMYTIINTNIIYEDYGHYGITSTKIPTKIILVNLYNL